ncbi:MAG TPA: C4-dicarboxylate ABC transporter permease [Bacteroidales bacterium]|nr:C4-dicarboxylate ABC transporter permease [Bacteroidales bacterium]
MAFEFRITSIRISMSIELIIFICMLTTFALSIFLFKLPAGVSLMLAAIVGALIGGQGLPVRHLVEGGFGFLEAILIISTAMIFMQVMQETGALAGVSRGILRLFYRQPTLLIIVITLFVMFPGMLTGLSSTCILTTGALVAPILINIGMQRLAVGALIAMAAVFGEVAPPISIPVMIIGGGVDMPYIGFGLPLLLVSLPPALITALYFRFRYLPDYNVAKVKVYLDSTGGEKYGFRLYIPIIYVILYMIGEIRFHEFVPHLGVPLIFIIGTVLGLLTKRGVKLIDVSRTALRSAMPVMAILVGVGMFLQILALTGVRGYLAVTALGLPEGIRYLAAGLMPFMGSAYGSASIIGVPLVYVFIGKSTLVVTAVLVLMAAMGDLMPPPALLCAYSSQIIDEPNHFRILKKCIIPMAVSMAIGLLILVFAQEIANLIL